MTAVYSYSMMETGSRLELRVRQRDGGDCDLEVKTGLDEVGVLFRLAAVLFAHQCDVRDATIGTDQRSIRDTFRITSEEPLSEERVQRILVDLRSLLFEGVSVLEYLKSQERLCDRQSSGGEVSITTEGGSAAIEVVARDQRGLLLTLSQAFYLMDIDISEASIRTTDSGDVRNTFRVLGQDARFESPEFRRRLGEELTRIL